MRQQQMEATLRKCQELLIRTLDDHITRLDANRAVDFMQGIDEIDAVLDRGDAGVAKLVDAVGLGPAAARRGGSSPSARTRCSYPDCGCAYMRSDPKACPLPSRYAPGRKGCTGCGEEGCCV